MRKQIDIYMWTVVLNNSMSKKAVSVIIILFFIFTAGCTGNTHDSSSITSTPTISPTENNVLRLYTETRLDKQITIDEHSYTSYSTDILQEGDELEITITDLTGGNRDIEIYMHDGSGKFRIDEYLTKITKGQGTCSWTVPKTTFYHISFDNRESDFYKELHITVDVTYTSTKERDWEDLEDRYWK